MRVRRQDLLVTSTIVGRAGPVRREIARRPSKAWRRAEISRRS
jgi:hypothetical protein